MNAIQVGDRVKISKGNRARGIVKGSTAQVTRITEQGADYGHTVRVGFVMLNGPTAGHSYAFYARHVNRLADDQINLNDGNPFHKIVMQRVYVSR